MASNIRQNAPQFWAVVPAGGSGTRMGVDKPKQYLTIAGKPIIEHTLECLLRHEAIAGVCVAVAPSDPYWSSVKVNSDKKVIVAPGGKERCHSVINALAALKEVAAADDWVLVHDAARPCVRLHDINKLIAQLKNHGVGGILAVPVQDTIKRSNNSGDIEQTIDRRHLWQAQTPQMFRLQMLSNALKQAIEDGFIVTDEASAMEHIGLQPRLIEGHADNIKITRPEDLPIAEFYIQQIMDQP